MRIASLCCWLVAFAGCEVRNPNARLDFGATRKDLGTTLTPPDLAPPFDLSPSGVQLTNGGLLESIAVDSQYVAFLPSETPRANQTVGPLTVMPLPSGPQTPVATDAYAAVFAGADALFYSLAPAASTDPGATGSYGALGLWLPGFAAGVTLSSGYAVVRTWAVDGSFALWWDAAAPSLAGTGDLKLARSADCKASGCAPITIAAGVAHPVSLIATTSHAAYAIRNGATYDVWLADVAAGTSTRIVSGGGSGAISFSSDGALLATVAAGGGVRVVSTADGSPVVWSALPAGARTHALAFADTTTLTVRALPVGATSDSAYVASSSAATLIASGVSGISVVRSGANGSTRWLLCAGPATTGGLGPVAAYDLTATAPRPIALATATSAALVAISYDQTYARVYEGYNSASATGTLTLVKLPDGTKTVLGDGVGASASSFVGPHGLMWIGAGGRLSAWRDGVVTAYAGGVRDFRTRSGTVYFTVGGSDDVHGYVPGIWFTALD